MVSSTLLIFYYYYYFFIIIFFLLFYLFCHRSFHTYYVWSGASSLFPPVFIKLFVTSPQNPKFEITLMTVAYRDRFPLWIMYVNYTCTGEFFPQYILYVSYTHRRNFVWHVPVEVVSDPHKNDYCTFFSLDDCLLLLASSI